MSHVPHVLSFVSRCAKLSNGGQDVEQFHSDFKDFITNCNGEQIRFATDMFAEYCHLYTQRLIESRQAIRGLLTLSRAIQKVQICPSQVCAPRVRQPMQPNLCFGSVDIDSCRLVSVVSDLKVCEACPRIPGCGCHRYQ